MVSSRSASKPPPARCLTQRHVSASFPAVPSSVNIATRSAALGFDAAAPSQAGHDRFPGGSQFVDGSVLQPHSRIRRPTRVGRGSFANHRSVTVLNFDSAPNLEGHERLSQRRATHAEFGSQAAFGRKPIAGRKTLSLDEIRNVLGQLLVQARTLQSSGQARARAGR